MTQERSVLETRGRQFGRFLDQLISEETDPQRKAGLENARQNIDISKIEKAFSPTNILVEQHDVNSNLYHAGSGMEHLLKIIFKAPEDRKEKMEPTFKVIEISLESNDLHYRKDGVSRHDWWSLIQIARWKRIEYADGLENRIFFVLDIGEEEHLLSIGADGRYSLHSRVAYQGR